MHTFYQPDHSAENTVLNSDESGHCVKVLRLKNHDLIRVVDGKGWVIEAKIIDANARKCQYEVISQQKFNADYEHYSLAIAPTKNLDRMEWFVEKAVELGVGNIYPLLCEHAERKVLKTDRLMRKAISAMKQSGNYLLPVIHDLQPFDTFMSGVVETQKFIAYLDQPPPPPLLSCIPKNTPVLVLIGPEGDFSKNEIELAKSKDFKPVNLGNSRLRTETAGIVSIQCMHSANL